ncbi:hypothetical protein OEA41_001006 [Lepraria neglecta]|uniref:Uncharacterized protein n=1 Tax=Lepraria neglecta TaxID=209136 RepID=A0AAE0DPZ3_9LECA|nr:hypothetical protein OEA41_001006 [Lepraria neglecta]
MPAPPAAKRNKIYQKRSRNAPSVIASSTADGNAKANNGRCIRKTAANMRHTRPAVSLNTPSRPQTKILLRPLKRKIFLVLRLCPDSYVAPRLGSRSILISPTFRPASPWKISEPNTALTSHNGIYAGQSALAVFGEFLDKAAQIPGILPKWWPTAIKAACMKLAAKHVGKKFENGG